MHQQEDRGQETSRVWASVSSYGMEAEAPSQVSRQVPLRRARHAASVELPGSEQSEAKPPDGAASHTVRGGVGAAPAGGKRGGARRRGGGGARAGGRGDA